MPPEDVSSQLEELSARVEGLERRISALEHPSQIYVPRLEPSATLATANLGPGEALVEGPINSDRSTVQRRK
jgi:hypothetical protein